MGYRDDYKFRPRTLEQTLVSERSKYLDARINAAIGFCPEPEHPVKADDDDDEAPKQQRRLSGASHQYKLGEISRRDYQR